jgi:hypothetical protein
MPRWLARVLSIHSPTQHALETCWCIGTKRELIVPGLYTKTQVLADMSAMAAYFEAIAKQQDKE